MSIINNILNDEYGLVYDNTTGRIYQKEVTWECDTQNDKSNVMPDWFKRWTETQRMNTGSVPRWFLEWLNKANISLPQMQMPSGIIGSIATGAPNTGDIPQWFKDWLSSQGRPSYPYQIPQPQTPYQIPQPQTPYPYQTVQPQTPYPYQTPSPQTPLS